MSKPEQKMYRLLNLVFSKPRVWREATFAQLKYKQALYCDFYLPDYNLVIEVDGHPNHFVDELTINRDRTKTAILLENGINLLRFDFYNHSEDMFKSKAISNHLKAYLESGYKKYQDRGTGRYIGNYRQIYEPENVCKPL